MCISNRCVDFWVFRRSCTKHKIRRSALRILRWPNTHKFRIRNRDLQKCIILWVTLFPRSMFRIDLRHLPAMTPSFRTWARSTVDFPRSIVSVYYPLIRIIDRLAVASATYQGSRLSLQNPDVYSPSKALSHCPSSHLYLTPVRRFCA